MTEKIFNLSGVPESMLRPLERYAELVRSLGGGNALALTLFGAIAAGTFDPALHSARSVLVLTSVDLEMLRRLAKEGPGLGKSKIMAPLIMTPDYIKASVDTFPLEFLEIRQRHLCVFGQDYFEPLTFHDNHIRHQCERELKSVLIGMRQALLASAGKERVLGEIETEIADRLMRILRGMLWLHGQREPKPAPETVHEIETSINRQLSGVRDAIDARGKHGWDDYKTLYEDVDALRTVVDAW